MDINHGHDISEPPATWSASGTPENDNDVPGYLLWLISFTVRILANPILTYGITDVLVNLSHHCTFTASRIAEEEEIYQFLVTDCADIDTRTTCNLNFPEADRQRISLIGSKLDIVRLVPSGHQAVPSADNGRTPSDGHYETTLNDGDHQVGDTLLSLADEVYRRPAFMHWIMRAGPKSAGIAYDLTRFTGPDVEFRDHRTHSDLETIAAGLSLNDKSTYHLGYTYLSVDALDSIFDTEKLDYIKHSRMTYDVISNNCQHIWHTGLMDRVVCQCHTERATVLPSTFLNEVIGRYSFIAEGSFTATLLICMGRRGYVPWLRQGPLWPSISSLLYHYVPWLRRRESWLFFLVYMYFVYGQFQMLRMFRRQWTKSTSCAIDHRMAIGIPTTRSQRLLKSMPAIIPASFLLNAGLGFLYRFHPACRALEWVDLGLGLCATILLRSVRRDLRMSRPEPYKFCLAGVYQQLNEDQKSQLRSILRRCRPSE